MVAVWKLHQYLAVTHVSIGWIMALHGPGSSCWARWQRYNGRDKSNVLRHCCLRCQWEIFFLQKAIIIAASFPRSVVDVVRWNVLIDPFECQFNYSISWGLTRWSAKKNNFKVVYPGRFYSLISYSKAEKFNITSFFRSTEQWIQTSHLIPLMIEPVDTVIPVKTTFVCWCVPDYEQNSNKLTNYIQSFP